MGGRRRAGDYCRRLERAGAVVTAPYDATHMPGIWVEGAPQFEALVIVLGLQSVRDQALIQGLRGATCPCATLAVLDARDPQGARASIDSGAEVYVDAADVMELERAVAHTVARTRRWRNLLGQRTTGPIPSMVGTLSPVQGTDSVSRPTVQGMLRVLTQVARISAREREVLQAVLHGDSNQEIADDLKISIRTVKFHVTNLITKLEARNRGDILRVYFDNA